MRVAASGHLVWHHPFFTKGDESTTATGITYCRHAITETVFAVQIVGPLAHMPPGRLASNGAWTICAAFTYNLLRR